MTAYIVSVPIWLRVLFVYDITLTPVILSELIILRADIVRFLYIFLFPSYLARQIDKINKITYGVSLLMVST